MSELKVIKIDPHISKLYNFLNHNFSDQYAKSIYELDILLAKYLRTIRSGLEELAIMPYMVLNKSLHSQLCKNKELIMSSNIKQLKIHDELRNIDLAFNVYEEDKNDLYPILEGRILQAELNDKIYSMIMHYALNKITLDVIPDSFSYETGIYLKKVKAIFAKEKNEEIKYYAYDFIFNDETLKYRLLNP